MVVSEVSAPIDSNGEHDRIDDTSEFFRRLRCEERLRRAVAHDVRMLGVENRHADSIDDGVGIGALAVLLL